jgi:ABC-type antimicrobial peptide transport system permease subunit
MSSSKNHPPKFALKFFRWFCEPEMLDFIEGDLFEEYFERVTEKGKRKADFKFILDVILLFRPGIIKPISGFPPQSTSGMYKSYFKIGYRNLLKNKGYSFINIGGLAIGMAVAMLIGLWVYDELSFNTYHKNYDRIAQVLFTAEFENNKGLETNSPVPTGLGTYLNENYTAQFEEVTLVRSRLEERLFSFDENHFIENGYFMQPNGPKMFSLEMVAGSQDGLRSLTSVLLSESFSKKIFGDSDPIGKVVRFNEQVDLEVKGVYKDLPKNSRFHEAAYFAPLDVFLYGWSNLLVWDNQNMHLFVQLRDGLGFKGTSDLISESMNDNVDSNLDYQVFLHPMSDWHLRSEFENGQIVTSDRLRFIWIFSALGIAVLILACVNFMNLSTARSENRSKEIGIRKSMGSFRSQLVQQFLTESILVASFSFVFAILAIAISLSWFNDLAGKDMQIPWLNPLFWLVGICITLLTGLIAGSYPALYLSSFNPVKTLKGAFKTGKYTAVPRKVLVVFQFTISISLIIGTIIIYQQIQYVKDRPVGYLRDGLIMMPKVSTELYGKYDVFRDELIKTGAVEEIGEANYPLTNVLGNNDGFSWDGMEEGNNISFNTIRVNQEYGKAIGWNVIAGRDFTRENKADNTSVIITESAMEKMNFTDPVGRVIKTDNDYWGARESTIIGVVKDLIKGDPFAESKPAIMFLNEDEMQWQFIRIKDNYPLGEALIKIENTFKRLAPDAYTDLKVMEEEYLSKFKAEERIGKLGAFFSTFAIFISCLGLFGLASYLTEKRAKEIGVRKVLGASTQSIWQLLTKDFFLLVVVASIIASPISYYFLTNWINTYHYQMDISLGVFIWTCLGATIVTLLTVGYQTIKSAIANPVNSLRSE